MATFVLEDLEAAIEVMVFPRTMAEYGHLLDDDAIVVRQGPHRRARRHAEAHRHGGQAAGARDGGRSAGAAEDPCLPSDGDARWRTIKRILEAHPGESGVLLHVEDGRRTTVLRLGPDFCVDAGNALHAELRVLLGADSVF